MPFCFETVAMQHFLVYFHRCIFKVSRTSIPLKTPWRTCIMEVPFLPKTEPPFRDQNLYFPSMPDQCYFVVFFHVALCDRILNVWVRSGQSKLDYKHRAMIMKYRAATKQIRGQLNGMGTMQTHQTKLKAHLPGLALNSKRQMNEPYESDRLDLE